jgi:hypothetical protein
MRGPAVKKAFHEKTAEKRQKEPKLAGGWLELAGDGDRAA